MQWTDIVVRYGEIFLKGKNRGDFEKKLLRNIKIITGQTQAKLCAGRIFMPYWQDHTSLRRVFGLTSYSCALRVEKKMETIITHVDEIVRDQNYIPLIAAHRSDKNFEVTSPEITKMIATHLHEIFPSYKFDDTKTLTVEIQHGGAYLCAEKLYCSGGLPTGCDGQVLLLVEDTQSILAGLLCMKRGMNAIPVAFCEKDVSLLEQFSASPVRLHLVRDWSEIEGLARRMRVEAIACGQTFENFAELNTPLLPLRPLIAYTPEKIEQDYSKYKERIL